MTLKLSTHLLELSTVAMRLTVWLLVLSIAHGIVVCREIREWKVVRQLSEISTKEDEYAPRVDPVRSSQFSFQRDGKVLSLSLDLLLSTALSIGFNVIENDRSNNYFASGGMQRITSAFISKDRVSKLNLIDEITRLPIEELSDESFNSHPALSEDGKTLVWASDREGGEGGVDLWISSIQPDGRFGEPMSLGERLNSAGNEITPCWIGNDTLVFSSNGFGGKGGYELFQTVLRAGEWTAPLPIEQLNSSDNESDPSVFVVQGKRLLVFASDRSGGSGGLDLYLAQEELTVTGHVLSGASEIELSCSEPLVSREAVETELPVPFPIAFFENGEDIVVRVFERAFFAGDNQSPVVGSWWDDLVRRASISPCTIELSTNRENKERSRWNELEARISDKIRIDGLGKVMSLKNVKSDFPFCRVYFADSAATAPVLVGQKRVICEPQELHFKLDMRPREIGGTSWCLDFFTPNPKPCLRRGDSLPAEITIPVNELCFEMENSRELSVRAIIGKQKTTLPITIQTTVRKVRVIEFGSFELPMTSERDLVSYLMWLKTLSSMMLPSTITIAGTNTRVLSAVADHSREVFPLSTVNIVIKPLRPTANDEERNTLTFSFHAKTK